MISSPRRSGTVVNLQAHKVRNASSAAQGRLSVLYLIVFMVVGALLRLDFMRAGQFVIDSDEAIVGLMARHIIEGRAIPTFYYGQHYMGSLEPLCAAGLFYLFGPSPFVLQLVPLLFSVALIGVMYLLGREVGGVVVGRVAALLCALPPAALVVWSYKARGGFIELLVIGALAMLFTLRWLKGDPTKLGYASLAWFFLGVGWWVNNQVLYFVAPIGLWGALHVIRAMRTSQLSIFSCAVLCLNCLAAFFVGSAPYWVYNFRNGFPSLGMFGLASFLEIWSHFIGLWGSALPIILGAKGFWESSLSFDGATVVAYTLYSIIFITVLAHRKVGILRPVQGRVDSYFHVGLFIFFLIFTCGVFTTSTYGWLSQAPRYLLPLYVGIFVVCGIWARILFSFSRAIGILGVGALVSLNLSSSYYGGRALPGEPIVFDGQRVSRDHTQLIAVLDSLDIKLIRTNYWIGYRLAFETAERITFRVLQEPRQVRMPEYEKLPSSTTQDRIPLVIVPGERAIFAGALTLLGYTFEERQASGYIVISNINRPAVNHIAIPTDQISTAIGSGKNVAGSAIDGSDTTRWGTGMPQSAGQLFEVAFKDPQLLSAIKYSLGDWHQDFPRGLKIEGEDEAGRRSVILSSADYSKLAAFFKGEDLEVWFPERQVKRVVFSQTGSHPILDWSIAELYFFSGSVDTSPAYVKPPAK